MLCFVGATLVVLQLFVWAFALMFISMGALILAGLDLLMWLEAGAAAGAIHLAVIAAVMLRRAARPTSGGILI